MGLEKERFESQALYKAITCTCMCVCVWCVCVRVCVCGKSVDLFLGLERLELRRQVGGWRGQLQPHNK